MNPLSSCTVETLYLYRAANTSWNRWLVISISRAPIPTKKVHGTYKSRAKAVGDLEAAGYRSNGIEDDNYGEIWMRRDGKVVDHA